MDKLNKLIADLRLTESSDECVDVSEQISECVSKDKSLFLPTLNAYVSYMMNTKDGVERESGLIGMYGLVKSSGKMGEPFFVHHLSSILFKLSDRGQAVREAAEMLLKAIFQITPSPRAVPILLEILLKELDGPKWQIKLGAVDAISHMAKFAPQQIGYALPELIPVMTNCLHETKLELSKTSRACMTSICAVADNRDFEPHLPVLIDCFASPDQLTECIRLLSNTTFVQDVTMPALAILVPILVRSLNERSADILRRAVIIVDNVFKMVKDPMEAQNFLPLIKPCLEKIVETAALPEVRALAQQALNSILKIEKDIALEPPTEVLDGISTKEQVFEKISELLGDLDPNYSISVKYVSSLIHSLIVSEEYSAEQWENNIVPYISLYKSAEESKNIALEILKYYKDLDHQRRMLAYKDVDDGEGELVCNCDFSLAYGAMMLLNRTTLRLRRGRRYGLCGRNGAGKTTLMTAIANGKLEGFPPEHEVKCVMVAHSLQGEDTTLSIVDFVCADERLTEVPREKIIGALSSVGFDDDRRNQSVGSLSGGWKMKLELARAMLMNADVLLLDEPTNHLDVINIAWLENYLNEQSNITCLIVSHDSGFLDNVCTDIIHYERKKLVYYKGNLSEFVKKRPEAKTYYTLSDTSVKFKFPQPSILMGINSNTKTILKMTNCSYTYPGNTKPSLSNVSVNLSLSSRVAIIGPNGAGKSTMIKLLTGENIPQEGSVWKHPNLRIGYVAQHAFHHLNQHLEKTANQYVLIQWRFKGGEDREVLEKETRKFTDDDIAQMDKEIDVDGHMRKIENIIGRQKFKKTFQYEIKWKNLAHKHNSWMNRDELLSHGFSKIVQAYDDRVSSREGQNYRQLIPSEIRAHFESLGLDGDIADHNELGGLSGGQKVKVVIAAAMWNNCHMLILDEPTNFLDRDSLGGLAVAIRDWQGAVVMISHNTEFVGALCPETWNINAGKLSSKGVTEIAQESFDDHVKSVEKKVRPPKKKKMTRNELKAREVRRRQRYLRWLTSGEDREPDTESD